MCLPVKLTILTFLCCILIPYQTFSVSLKITTQNMWRCNPPSDFNKSFYFLFFYSFIFLRGLNIPFFIRLWRKRSWPDAQTLIFFLQSDVQTVNKSWMFSRCCLLTAALQTRSERLPLTLQADAVLQEIGEKKIQPWHHMSKPHFDLDTDVEPLVHQNKQLADESERCHLLTMLFAVLWLWNTTVSGMIAGDKLWTRAIQYSPGQTTEVVLIWEMCFGYDSSQKSNFSFETTPAAQAEDSVVAAVALIIAQLWSISTMKENIVMRLADVCQFASYCLVFKINCITKGEKFTITKVLS